jgi:hypothetical protein
VIELNGKNFCVISLLSNSYKIIITFFSQGETHICMKLFAIIRLGFDVTEQLTLAFLHSSGTGKK